MNATTQTDFDAIELPRWQEPVVLASMAAIAVAAGLGLQYEAGVAPWLSTTTALATAAVLYMFHRALRPHAGEHGHDGIGIARDMSSVGPPQRPLAEAPPPVTSTVTPTPTFTLPPPLPPTAQSLNAGRASPQPPDLAHFVPRQPPSLSASAPPPTAPPVQDIKLEELEALIRQMAAGVPGPKATTSDPDLPSPDLTLRTPVPPSFAEAYDNPPQALQVGFGKPVVAEAGRRVAEAVAAERLDVLLTPIQSLTEQRASHFEVSVRLRDEEGAVLTESEVAQAARQTGLSGALDALKLSRVARVARRVQARGGAPADVLADIFGPSLADSAFITATGSILAGNGTAPIVLSLAQSDVRTFGRVHWSALATLGDFGLRFAISDVTDLDMDFELMAARGFIFAKLDAGVFLDGLPLGMVVIPATDVARHLSGCGLTVIVGHIDDVERLDQIAACGVSLGQGALFGEPKPVRQDVLAGPAQQLA